MLYVCTHFHIFLLILFWAGFPLLLHPGGGFLSQHSSYPETTEDEKTFHISNDAMFLSSAAVFRKQKIRRQSCHPQAELAAPQTGANGPDADAREHTSY